MFLAGQPILQQTNHSYPNPQNPEFKTGTKKCKREVEYPDHDADIRHPGESSLVEQEDIPPRKKRYTKIGKDFCR